MAGRGACAGRRTRPSARQGSEHPSAKAVPDRADANRHLAVFDPKTQKYTFVDTCFGTHHLQFGYDANDTLWTSGGGQVLGWLNTQDVRRDRRRRESRRAGPRSSSTPTATAGATTYVEPDQPVDPAKDKRIAAGFYAVMPNPVDGSIWGS